MPNIKNYKILIGIFLVVCAVGSTLMLMPPHITPENQPANETLKENTTNKDKYDNQTEVVIKISDSEEIEKSVQELEKRENIIHTSTIYSSLENSPFTSKPTFKVGEKYTYKIKTPVPFQSFYNSNTKMGRSMEDYVYYNVTFIVDKKERINKSDYYVLSTTGSGEVFVGYIYKGDKKSALRMTFIPPSKWYINTENGKIFNEDMEEIIPYTKIYHPWMLKLSEGLKFTIKKEEKSTGNVECSSSGGITKCNISKEESTGGSEETYEVEGIEKINGKKCFKIKGELKLCSNKGCSILHTMIYWVDVEKRITVKYQEWYEGIITVEDELIDYQK